MLLCSGQGWASHALPAAGKPEAQTRAVATEGLCQWEILPGIIWREEQLFQYVVLATQPECMHLLYTAIWENFC